MDGVLIWQCGLNAHRLEQSFPHKQTNHLVCHRDSSWAPYFLAYNDQIYDQMYVDKAIIYVHAKAKQQVAHKLTAALSNISHRHQIVSDLVS